MSFVKEFSVKLVELLYKNEKIIYNIINEYEKRLKRTTLLRELRKEKFRFGERKKESVEDITF